MGFSTLLLVMFMVMFWLSRVGIAVMVQMGANLLGLVSWNLNYEIILLFFTILCMILVVKRKLLGSILYFVSYAYYFGIDLYNRIQLYSQNATDIDNIINMVVAAIGIFLAFSVLTDSIVTKVKKGKPKNQKTDWFFDNKDFDRKFDERADRNEYKF